MNTEPMSLGKTLLRRGRRWALPTLLCGLYLLVCLLAGARVLEHAQPHPIGQTRSDTPAGPLYGSLAMGQTFRSRYPGLYRVDVAMATYARENTQDVIFILRESPTATDDLVTIVVNAREIQDNAWHRFEFAPLADSTDRTFYFFLTSPTSTPDDAVTIYGRTGDSYQEGQAYLNGQPAGGDLTFLTFYREATLADTVDVILTRVTRSKPGWLGQAWFTVALFALSQALAVALLVGIWRWGDTQPFPDPDRDDMGASA